MSIGRMTMRHQGKITDWKDDQGFGFITPNDDGSGSGSANQVFVHISAFSNRSPRPVVNDIVTYKLTVDEKGRTAAEKVAFIGEHFKPASSRGRGAISIAFAILFIVFVAALVFVGKLPAILLGLYLGASIVTFSVYAFDKSAARNNRWRIQESTLQLLGLMGGWPGALVAQQLLRHKSKKMSFKLVLWITVILNGCALFWLFTPEGSAALRSILTAIA